MTKLIIIETNHSKSVENLLRKNGIDNYKIYQTPNQKLPTDWETKALAEWTKLSDEQITKELDSIND